MRLLVLDYGYTLYRFSPAYPRLLHEALAEHLRSLGAEASAETVARVMDSWGEGASRASVQRSVYHAAAVLLLSHGLRATPGRMRETALLIRRLVSSLAYPAPGARELLEWCRSRGVAVAILSNNWCGECIIDTLERDGLADYVDLVVSSDWVGYRKPLREALEEPLRLLGVEGSRAALIDDYREAVEAARGVYGLAVLHDGRRLDEWIPVLEAFYSSR